MADSQGGRARGRGRARSRQPGEQVQQPSRAPAAPPGMAADIPAPSVSGRAAHRGTGPPVDAHTARLAEQFGQLSVGGEGEGSSSIGRSGAPVGRGNMRGKRQICFDMVRTRPETLTTKQGSLGQKVNLQANYFSLVSMTDWCLFQYRVDFAPDIDLTQERKKLLRVQQKNIGGEYIFDGTVMYCSHRIPAESLEVFSARESDDSQVRITIKLVGQLEMGDGHYIQFFNILTRKCLTMLKLKVIHRDYFDPLAKVELRDHHLELWPGYKTTIRQHEQSVLMCAEITHKVMRTDTCHQLLMQLIQSRDYRADFTRAVLGSVVLTDYNNRTYVICDVNWDETPLSTFDRGGTKVSYMQYYQERYNIRIKDGKQPLLVSKSKTREPYGAKQQAAAPPGASAHSNLILLIPELCRLTGLRDDMRSNFTLMKEMAKYTRIAPEERQNRLYAMNQRLNGEERVRREFQQWKMKLSTKLVDVPGRILPGETIVLGCEKSVPAGDKCDWTLHLRSNPMLVMPEGGLQRWVILYPSRLSLDVREFVTNLTRAAKGMQFVLSEPEYQEMGDDRTQSYVDRLDHIISRLNPQLIVVVLMNNRADRYSAVKKKTLVERAVPSQVVLAKNLNKKGGGAMSVATKIAIQMNCKIGGAPWTVRIPLSGVMVVGFDVCHDPKSREKSYGALVASLNRTMSRYYSAVSHHKNGAELSNDIATNITKALKCYMKYNKNLPTHIIIYRDGVGDGQIPTVFSHEVEEINRSIKQIYEELSPGSKPKMGFIIVCKRINTRLFLGKNNPQPGTIVDDVITLPERYDFFVVSQYTNQGTVSPTSYNVIHDTLGLIPDRMQLLTYKLTHCYYNWSGTVAVPAPVQYAHKLAFLTSQSLHRAPNHCLEDLLFFL